MELYDIEVEPTEAMVVQEIFDLADQIDTLREQAAEIEYMAKEIRDSHMN